MVEDIVPRIGFWENYIGNRVEYSGAGVWAAEAHLMSWEMIWVEDSVLVFDWSKVFDQTIANLLEIGKALTSLMPRYIDGCGA